MTEIVWDAAGEHRYQTGVSHGVLYPQDQSDGSYPLGVAWNGLTTVTESPAGAESNKVYADNIVYLNLRSAETWGGTIEALTYPREFGACDGTAEVVPGLTYGQQGRQPFGFCYSTIVGNDVNPEEGEIIHIFYGATAAPSEKAHATVNDSPEATPFSWEVDTIPSAWSNGKPVSTIDIDSTVVDADAFTALTDILYGVSGDPRLPLPDEIEDIFGGSVTVVDLGVSANQPTYVSGTHIVTLPAVTGVQWKINGVNKSSGAQPAMTSGQSSHVTAHPLSGYTLTGSGDWDFDY